MEINNKKQANLLTILIGISQLYAWATTYYIPATIVNIVAEEIKQSRLITMGGFSLALLVSGLAAPKIGVWIENKGGRLPLVIGSLLMGAGLMVLSATTNVYMWYIAWIILGLGMALGLFNAAFASLGRIYGADAKKVIIRVTLISGFATLLWPCTTKLIATYGFRHMALVYSMVHIFLWAPLFFFFIPKNVVKIDDAIDDEKFIIRKNIKIAFFCLILYAILRSIIGTAISVNILNMFKGLGLTLSIAALVAALIGPAQIIGRLIEMYFGRNFDPIKSSIFWTAVLPVAIFVLVIFGKSSASFFAIAYGMSNGVLTITMGLLPMILFGVKGYAKLLGKIALPVLISQAITPILVQPLVDNCSAIFVFIIAGILGIVSLICIYVLFKLSKKT